MNPSSLFPSKVLSRVFGTGSRAMAISVSFLLASGAALVFGEDGTRKFLEDFSGGAWSPSRYSMAPGSITLLPERAPDLETGGSMKVHVSFGGQGFEHFTAEPPKPLYIPGNAKRITMRVKRPDNRIPMKVLFVDGWGKTDKDMGWELKLDAKPEWQTVTFDVPESWVKPVGISGISSHNFSFKTDKVALDYFVSGIEAETDISGVDPSTGLLRSWKPEPSPADASKALKQAPATPLLSVSLSTSEQANIFSGKPAACTMQVVNWNPGALDGKASFRVTDQNGAEVQAWEEAVHVEAPLSRTYPIKAARYGIYKVTAHLEWADKSTLDKSLVLANVPVLPEPTEAQKLASPYGINYHGGGDRLFEAFKKAGFYWYRDYAFHLDGMVRAKGADRNYKGWPNFPGLLADYDRLGLICLPVLFTVEPPVMADGKVVRMGPDRKWVLDMADVLTSFPKIRFWELGNEYDLKHGTEELPAGWKNYYLYHKKFGELVSLLGDGQVTAVEQGRAGVYPVFVEAAVKSGAFDQIGVVNSHHYTGVEPPETNADNFNSGERLPGGVCGGHRQGVLVF